MTKKIYSMFAMLSLCLMLAVVSVQAQSGSKLTVNVPFDFSIGSQVLPAGEYQLKQLSDKSILVESADGRTRLIAQTPRMIQDGAHEGATQEKLVFNQYGDQYFLAQVFMIKGGAGRELNQSNAERQAAKEQNLASGGAKLKKVEVAARVR